MKIIDVEYIIINYFNMVRNSDKLFIRDINIIKRIIENNYNWCYIEADHDTIDSILYKYSEYLIKQDNYILKTDINHIFVTNTYIDDIVRKSINVFILNKSINSIIK
jgi:hypothetical protein